MMELAIRGGQPVRDVEIKPWPAWPVFGDAERKLLDEVFESGKWWNGEKGREFGEKFAAVQDAGFGIPCTNGSAALELGLLAAGIRAGDEVIIPPYTFVATATSVVRVNAVPVFADIDVSTANLDPEDVRKKITDRTRAIMPVHFAGLPVDMDAFGALAKEHDLLLIEDACHSWGSKWKGKGTGALGNCGAFSFQMSKNITSGEGGIVLTDDEGLADRVWEYANCGRRKEQPWYEHFVAGTNMRMTEFQAAILLGQLTRLEEQTEKRAENAAFLEKGLSEIPGIELTVADERVTRRAYHLFVMRFDEDAWGVSRERFMECARAEGVSFSPGYLEPTYRSSLFRETGNEGDSGRAPFRAATVDYSGVSCPNTETLCRRALWVTQSMLLGTREDMLDIVRTVKKLRENQREMRQD